MFPKQNKTKMLELLIFDVMPRTKVATNTKQLPENDSKERNLWGFFTLSTLEASYG